MWIRSVCICDVYTEPLFQVRQFGVARRISTAPDKPLAFEHAENSAFIGCWVTVPVKALSQLLKLLFRKPAGDLGATESFYLDPIPAIL